MPRLLYPSKNASDVQAKVGDILSLYTIVGKKGHGTFSEVLECHRKDTQEEFAIKKLKAKIKSVDQANRLREVQAMKKLAKHPNILLLNELIFEPQTSTLYLILELMDMNLYELIRGRKKYLHEKRIKYYLLQMVDGLRYVHKNGIFHRDIKPENILVKNDKIKLADFGSCRWRESHQPYTEYISTRWYRAPECLLTDGYYNYKMDNWSIGCVFFEISSLNPLFPGRNEIDQIDRIHKLLGSPSQELISNFKLSRTMRFSFPSRSRDDAAIAQLTKHMNPNGVDLLLQLLEYDPEKRISMEDACQHSYIKSLSDELKKKKSMKRAESLDSQRDHGSVATEEEKKSASNLPVIPEKKVQSGLLIHKKPEPYNSMRIVEQSMFPKIQGNQVMGVYNSFNSHIINPSPTLQGKTKKSYPYHSTSYFAEKNGFLPRV